MDTRQPYLPPRCREAYSGHLIEVQANYRSAETSALSFPAWTPPRTSRSPSTGETLTIHAGRWQRDREPHRTEFRYGSLTQSVRLPA
jgi:hypothetical protein